MSAGPSAERTWAWYAAISGAATLALELAYFVFPATRAALTLEDLFLENLTALVFAAGAVVGFVAFYRRRQARRSDLLLPLAALAGLLDEISFGQRLLAFTPPELHRMPVDGVHDLFLVAYSVFETDNALYLAAYAALAVIALGAAVWAARPRGPLARAAPSLRAFLVEHPPFRYLLLAVGFVAVSLVLDLDLIENHWLMFLEELLEFQVALALAFGGAAIGTRPASRLLTRG